MRIPVLKRSALDRTVEQAAKALAQTTGDSPAFWTRVLRWRVRHFAGVADGLSRALTARTQDGQTVFAVE